MKFTDRIRKKETYPGIQVIESQEYPGIDAVFFTKQGGVSEDHYQGDKLVGAYAGLNVGSVTKDNPDAIRENIRMATDYVGAVSEQVFLLEPRYGAGVYSVNSGTQEGITELGVRKITADALITDDPNTVLACVSGDAHPIIIKAQKLDGSPVAGVVLASWHSMFKGVLNKTIKKMVTEFDIDPRSVAIEVGPGLGPSCIEGYDPERDVLLSGTSYEIGKKDAHKFIPGIDADFSGYRSDDRQYFSPEVFHYCAPEDNAYFDKAATTDMREDTRTPIFKAHPTNPDKCVIDIEALVRQTASIAMDIRKEDGTIISFPGVNDGNISAVNRDNFREVENFYSARGQQSLLDKEEVKALGDNAPLYSHIGRHPILVRLLPVIAQDGRNQGRGL